MPQKKPKLETHEKVTQLLIKARDIAREKFGDAATPKIIERLYDDLPVDRNYNLNLDELAEWEDELDIAIAAVKVVYDSSDPEVILGTFERQFEIGMSEEESDD